MNDYLIPIAIVFLFPSLLYTHICTSINTHTHTHTPTYYRNCQLTIRTRKRRRKTAARRGISYVYINTCGECADGESVEGLDVLTRLVEHVDGHGHETSSARQLASHAVFDLRVNNTASVGCLSVAQLNYQLVGDLAARWRLLVVRFHLQQQQHK